MLVDWINPIKRAYSGIKLFSRHTIWRQEGQRKKLVKMLTRGIQQNDEVTLEVDGEQEEQALQEFGAVLTHIFEE